MPYPAFSGQVKLCPTGFGSLCGVARVLTLSGCACCVRRLQVVINALRGRVSKVLSSTRRSGSGTAAEAVPVSPAQDAACTNQ
jgi:hypothetical protein